MPFFGGGGGDYHIIVTNIKGGTDAAPSVVGSNNMALGNGALQNATLCDYNIAIGNSAGNSLTDGGYNVIIGGLAGNALQQSSDTNIIIGYQAAFNSPASSRGNVIIGTGAYSNVALSVDNCVILGVNAQNLSGANNSVTIGANSNSGNNSIAIKGTAGNNAIVIGDVSQSSIFIGGLDFSAGPGQLPAGNDTEIQFNSGGAFGADPLFTYSAGVLSTPNAIVGDPGTEGTGITIGGVLYNSVFKVSDISSTDIAQSIIHRHSTTWEPIQVFARSNSNGSGHGVVTNGMLLSSQYTAGWTGTEYNLFGRAGFEAAATGTISDASSPGDYVIATTPDGGTLPVEAMRVTSDKKLKLNGQEIFPLVSIRLDKTLDQIIPFGGALTSITFQSQTVTVGGAVTVWNAINPERITIPPGYTKAKFIGQLRLDDAFANQIYANHITKNGVLTYSGVPINNGINVSGGGLNITASSEWLSVAPGDFFTMAVINTSATTNNNVLGTVRTWFGVELMP